MAIADIVRQDVLDIAPELTTRLTDGAWDKILLYVNGIPVADACRAGLHERDITLARCLLAAHLGLTTSRAGSGAAGPVVSESAGGLRRSYGLIALTRGDASLGSTIYGQQYLLIIGSSLAHGPVVV